MENLFVLIMGLAGIIISVYLIVSGVKDKNTKDEEDLL
jgi:hypothetical protein